MKSIKTILLITYIILNTSLSSFAQINELANNEMKYWKLRGRLIGDENNKGKYNGFMTVGSGDGKSIPAGQRHPSYSRQYYTFEYFPNNEGKYQSCHLQKINGVNTYAQYDLLGNITSGSVIIDPRDGKDLKGILEWGDNSLISIGQYLSILATEYRSLKVQGASTDQTVMEMYYAYLAIERLDNKGETMYGITSDLNGFLMRNDVPTKFELNNTGQNIDLVTSIKGCESTDDDKIYPKLENECEYYTVNKFTNAMSQDEVVGLLMGFTLVDQYVGSSAVYNGKIIRDWNSEITAKIINYVKNGGGTKWWIITDPKQSLPVCRGPLAIANSYPIAKIGKRICKQNFQNGYSGNLGRTIWENWKNLLAINNYKGLIYVQVPNLIINNPSYSFPNYVPVVAINDKHDGAYNVSMFLKLAACASAGSRPLQGDFTGKNTINTIAQTYRKQVYDLLGGVTTGYNPVLSSTFWKGEFNYLNCGCNCIQGNNAIDFHGCNNYQNTNGTSGSYIGRWNLEDRWAFDSINKAVYANYADVILDEYTGMDYMLAYNLYRAKHFPNGYISKIRMDVKNGSFQPIALQGFGNVPSFTIGNNQNPFVKKAVFSIESSNYTIGSNAVVNYTAGSDIKLKPGFKVTAGSVFKAKIEEYDCTPTPIYAGNNVVAYSYKTEDTTSHTIIWDETDTTEAPLIDEDTLTFDQDLPYDTSVYIVRYSPNQDTVWIDLNPDYIVDEDGNPTYAPQNGQNKNILQQSTFDKLTLYPNPTNDLAYLEYILYYDSDIRVRVYNQLGQYFSGIIEQEWYTQTKGKHKLTLNTASLAPGMYYCEFSIDGKREVKKFTVMK